MRDFGYRATFWLATAILVLFSLVACRVPPERAAMFPTVTRLDVITGSETAAPATSLPLPTAKIEPTSVRLTDLAPEATVETAPDPRAPQLQAYLEQVAASGQFMGTVLVADDGMLLVNDGYGFADLASGRPNTPQTQLRIGSLTKQFTAAAILRLQEQGLLGVDDPLSKYLPGYPEAERITIHHLLTHTAGVPNYTERPDLEQVVQAPISLDALLTEIAARPLQFAPGQQFSYSDSGYVILTKIIEVVSGQSYADFMRNEFFEPLGMSRSGYDYLDPTLAEPASGYRMTPDGPQLANVTDSSWASGAGALYSTTTDLFLWDRALYGGLLNEDSREAMFTPWTATDQDFAYGYGWELGELAGRPSQAHAGVIFGFGSFIARFPQDDAVIIVLGNGLQRPPRRIAGDLAQILFGRGNP